ncbi:MAG TPA: aldo/keto reductase [Thermoleophilaceae bacterium]|jgi:aryl-alcohol dehydrogenase-like predicted oxidoreductase|nr:aldo/keto reductase [Thermoleophilaceae bacterium]
MQRRRLGRTGLEVSEIGYGAWGISGVQWEGAEDDESIRALNRAIDLGLNFIDTAAAYGDGHSERLVGRVVRERPERVYVASKVPPKNLTWPAAEGIRVEDVFPGEHVRRFTERTLSNLGLETLDVQQLHVWRDEWLDEGDWQETVEALRQEGKIRFFGVSINDHEPESALRIVESGIADTVQVIYNIFDQSAAERLFGAVREHDVGVIVRVALDEGGLTGRITPETTFPEGDFRNHYFRGERKQAVMERVHAIVEDLGIEVDDMAATALRFVLSEPAVSTVIPGMRSVRNVERNTAVGDGQGLPAEQVEKLRRHRWQRDFYSDSF